jgi:bifunctional non-homologous end joining protein LigD
MIKIPTTPYTITSLYFREGNSDKEYHAAIEPREDGYVVNFAYGRRGNTLTAGTKTQNPVPLKQAQAIHQKLVASKIAKGYQPGNPGRPYRQSPIPNTSADNGHDSGIRCQLLNPVEECEMRRLLTGTTHCLQEKYDGRRLLVRKQGDVITGINRRGLVVAIPEPIRHAVEEIPFDVLIDGEAVGDTLHAFDLLEVKGNDLRQRRYLDRFSGLIMVIPPCQPALRWVSTVVDPNDKVEAYEELRQNGCEGVVFKDINAPFSPGRPNSGGTQLKYKFVESASFVVTGHNAKRSVALGLCNGDGEEKLVPAGNVTIPPNHPVPDVGAVVDCRYLYCLRQSGAIYQPVYIGPRSDIPASECTTDQLKYKAEANDMAAA